MENPAHLLLDGVEILNSYQWRIYGMDGMHSLGICKYSRLIFAYSER